MVTTFVPLAAIFWLMYEAMQVSYLLTLLLAFPAAGLLVRTFIIMHDCGHGSFFKSRRANQIFGWVTRVLTLTPIAQWRSAQPPPPSSSGAPHPPRPRGTHPTPGNEEPAEAAQQSHKTPLR